MGGSGVKRVIRSRGVMTTLCACMALGVLLWLKLKVVATVPRTAYAEPRETVAPKEAPPGARVEASEDERAER